MTQLQDKRLIITGAGSGIGKATAIMAAREGASVVAVDLTDAANDTAATITAAGGNARAVVGDAATEEGAAHYVDVCVKTFGGVDGIYANAGIGGGGKPVLELDVADWEKTLRVNTIGPFLAIKHVAPHLIKQGGGALLMTASVAGLRANAGGSDYSASKAGVISLAQTVAYQLYGTNVRINAICPGLIETGMTKPIFDRADSRGTKDRIGQVNPTGRNGEPEEIAHMACFLLSDAASYVNGQAIPVDGGLSASHPWVYPNK